MVTDYEHLKTLSEMILHLKGDYNRMSREGQYLYDEICDYLLYEVKVTEERQ